MEWTDGGELDVVIAHTERLATSNYAAGSEQLGVHSTFWLVDANSKAWPPLHDVLRCTSITLSV